MLAEIGAAPRDVLRDKDTQADALGLLSPAAIDDQIIEAMVDHPIQVNRPIVVTPEGAKLCRPSAVVLGILDSQPDHLGSARPG